MSPATTTHVHELLEQLDRLKALHRAGESPSFGQVEALFDLAAVVRASLSAADPARSAAWPTPERTVPRQVEALSRQLATVIAGAVQAALVGPEKGGAA